MRDLMNDITFYQAENFISEWPISIITSNSYSPDEINKKEQITKRANDKKSRKQPVEANSEFSTFFEKIVGRFCVQTHL